MLRIVVPLAAGILAADYAVLPYWFLAVVFVVSGAAAMLLRSSAALVLLLLTAGFADAQLGAPAFSVPVELPAAFAVHVEGMPSDRGRYASAEGIVEAWRDPAGGTWHAAADRIVVYADSLVPLSGGERFYCRGTVRPFRGGSENYRRLMARRGFAGTLRVSERNLLDSMPDGEENLHVRASGRLRALGGSGDAAAVVRAMTAGDRSGVGRELREAYARSGMSHLLAVSGLHTGIVFLVANLLLWWLPLLRRGHLVRNLLVVAAVWVYVAAAGFPASAVRAAVMCTLLQTALASGSEYVALNALGAAAAGMLLWNPAWLGDIGFQLSFVAVGAILAWGVPLCRRLHTRFRVLNPLTDALAVGFTASLATAPLVSHTFGIVALLGLALNPVVVLLAAVVVGAGVVCLVLPPLACVAMPVAEGAAALLNTLSRAVASVPGGVVEYALSARATAALYLFFAAATLAAWCAEPKKNVHLPS